MCSTSRATCRTFQTSATLSSSSKALDTVAPRAAKQVGQAEGQTRNCRTDKHRESLLATRDLAHVKSRLSSMGAPSRGALSDVETKGFGLRARRVARCSECTLTTPNPKHEREVSLKVMSKSSIRTRRTQQTRFQFVLMLCLISGYPARGSSRVCAKKEHALQCLTACARASAKNQKANKTSRRPRCDGRMLQHPQSVALASVRGRLKGSLDRRQPAATLALACQRAKWSDRSIADSWRQNMPAPHAASCCMCIHARSAASEEAPCASPA